MACSFVLSVTGCQGDGGGKIIKSRVRLKKTATMILQIRFLILPSDPLLLSSSFSGWITSYVVYSISLILGAIFLFAKPTHLPLALFVL